MMTYICEYLRNWFPMEKLFGDFTISGGAIQDQDLVEGQYFRIIGSKLNDGVWKFGTDELKDETFSGAVWLMAVPPAVEKIAKQISDWQAKYGTVDAMSPYTSESFGGYSYSKPASSDWSVGGWQAAFGSALAPWRKI